MEREENIRDNIIKLPKIELHCHLDGSLSREFVEKRLGRTVLEAELSVSDDCTSLAQYLEKFDLPGQCIQDEKGLEGAAYDVLKGMHRENVVYAEIRFAPLLSENEPENVRIRKKLTRFFHISREILRNYTRLLRDAQ